MSRFSAWVSANRINLYWGALAAVGLAMILVSFTNPEMLP